jgi:2-polyprenyl-3-methyl-5-hydroxy-6-metoxy-1,4-benzoquinol methylase
MVEKDYVSVENLDGWWGESELTAKHQDKYLKYFVGFSGKILEIGSDKGIVLELLKSKGLDSYGVDSNEEAVNKCRSKGLDVIHADAIDHLKSLTHASIGGIFCAHVIEHMDAKKAIEFINQCGRVLMPGAHLVVITPNARDLRVTERFWMDPTHVRPYPQKLLCEMINKADMKVVQVKEDQEPAKNILEKLLKKLVKIWFLGYMFRGDLIVIGKK